MLLAAVEYEHPDELRADLQQYYGINIDGMGVDYTHAHAAVLMRQLPLTSRLARIADPDSAWTDETHFLAAIEYDLRILAWQKTKDAQHGRNKPKPNKTPREIDKERKRREGFDKKLVDKYLGGE